MLPLLQSSQQPEQHRDYLQLYQYPERVSPSEAYLAVLLLLLLLVVPLI
jgi:hypothetical protein